MSFTSRKYLLVIAVLLIYSISPGQHKGAIFHHLEKKHGLSSSNVEAVIQDSEGLYWIATQNGLNRFDGTNIRSFYSNSVDSNSLSHNHCTSLIEDDNGDIWVGTLYGLNCYKKKEDKFQRIFLLHSEYVTDRLNWIRDLIKDKDGNIWIGTYGLWRYDIHNNRLDAFFSNTGQKENFFAGQIYQLKYDHKREGIWGSSSKGFVFLDRKKETFYYRDHNPYDWKIFDYSTGSMIALDDFGRLWFANYAGKELLQFDLQSGGLSKSQISLTASPRRLVCDEKNRIWLFYWSKPAQVFDPSSGVLDSTILSKVHHQSPLSSSVGNLFVEKKGNYWFCSPAGISIYNPLRQNKSYIPLPVNSSTNLPVSFTEAKLGHGNSKLVWLRSRTGVYRLNTHDFSFIKLQRREFLKEINGILPFGDSVLFISTAGRIYRYNHINDRIEKVKVLYTSRASFVVDKKNQLWIATWSGGLYKFNYDLTLLKHFRQNKTAADTGLRYDNIINTSGLLSDGKTFLLGYNNGNGFAEVDTYDDRITNFFMPQETGARRMIANTINCFGFDKQDRLWLGTFGGGIYIRDKNANFSNINQSDGLKSNFINAIVLDKRSDLWISTGDGINVLQDNGKIIVNPGNEIGLGKNDFWSNCIVLEDGSILAFDHARMVIFYPDKLHRLNQPDKLVISELRIFDKSFPLAGLENKLRLDHDQNFFSFEFSVSKTNPDEEVQYAYMLEGFDKNWIFVKKPKAADYTNVPPGTYKFIVKAAGMNGQWIHYSRPLIIRIMPAFWQTWWFYSTCIATVLFGIFLLYRNRISQLKKLLYLRTKISQDLHDEVGATLSGIAMYSHLTRQQLATKEKKVVEHSLDVIQQTASEMVTKLGDIVWVVNPEHDSLEKMIHRLQEYSIGMANAKNIYIRTYLAENLKGLKLSMETRKNIYLLCKEAVNNAVKYSGCSLLELNVILNDHQVSFEVKDNGKGFDRGHTKTGNGLLNMQQRAREIGSDLKIITAPGLGTSIILEHKIT